MAKETYRLSSFDALLSRLKRKRLCNRQFVLNYLRTPSGDPEVLKVATDAKAFEEGFVKDLKMDWKELADVMLATSYLHIQRLLDLTCDAAGDLIANMTVEQRQNKMITLKSSDGKVFEIDESVAKQSKTIQNMIDIDSDDNVNTPLQMDKTYNFPVPITSDALIKVIEYCKRHAAPVPADEKLYEIYHSQPPSDQSSSSESDVIELNMTGENENSNALEVDLNQPSSSSESMDDLKTFDQNFVKIDWDLLMDITIAANFLEIKGLYNLVCQAAADHIKDKTPEEVRILFNIENDFTPKEEEEIRKENAWAFE